MYTIEFLGGARKSAGLADTGENNCILFTTDDFTFCIDIGASPVVATNNENDPIIWELVKVARRLARKGERLSIFITHAHWDHWGRLANLFQVFKSVNLQLPVIYGSPFTIWDIKLNIQAWLRLEANKNGMRLSAEEQIEYYSFPSVDLAPWSWFSLNNLQIQAVPMDHSIPGAVGYLVMARKPIGRAGERWHRTFVTGDYKSVPWLSKITNLPQLQDVDLLLTDATSVQKTSSYSEEEVLQNIDKHIRSLGNHQRAFISMFSTNVERMDGVLRSALAADKIPGIFGPSMRTNMEAYRAVEWDKPAPSYESDAKRVEPQVILATGAWAQGDVMPEESRKILSDDKAPTLGMSGLVKLSYGRKIGQFFAGSRVIDEGENAWKGGVEIHKNDVVIFSASVYPFVEKDVYHVAKRLHDLGAEVIVDESAPSDWPFQRDKISASGHAIGPTIEELVNLIAPAQVAAYHCSTFNADIVHAMADHLHMGYREVVNNEVIEVM